MSDDWKPAPDYVPPLDAGQGDGKKGLEAIIGVNNLLGVAWLSRGVDLSGPVARVLVNGTTNKLGSGFLVGPDLFMTNNHVLPDPATALASKVEFNYQLAWNGQLAPTKTFDVSKFELTDQTLDFTLVRIANSPGDVFGFIDPTDRASVAVNDFVVIIQQPEGGPKQVALMDNKVSGVFGNVLQYTTDTEPGSSGSPVFNTHWQLVGLHHAGGDITGPDGKTTIFANEGIQLAKLAAAANGLLGDVDQLYAIAFGEMRTAFMQLIEVGLSSDLGTAATSMLAAHPSLADAVKTTGATYVAGQSPCAAVGAAGVGLGCAMAAPWVASTNPRPSAAKIGAGPSTDLTALISGVLGGGSSPAGPALYEQLIQKVTSSPATIANLIAGFPDSPTANQGVQVLIQSISAGAQALAP